MGLMVSVLSELDIYHASGRLSLKASDGGRKEVVVMEGTQPRYRQKWHWEMLKLARAALKHGQCRWCPIMQKHVIRWNNEVVLHSDQPIESKLWARKLLEAAEDIIRREMKGPEREVAQPVPKGGSVPFTTKAGGRYRLSNPK